MCATTPGSNERLEQKLLQSGKEGKLCTLRLWYEAAVLLDDFKLLYDLVCLWQKCNGDTMQ